MLGRKDQTSYGARIGRADYARQVLEDLDSFGAWAKVMLKARNVEILPG
jgi:hypothetical protein